MLQKICNFLSAVIMIILLAIAGILLLPSLIGYESMAVLSGSMEPNIGVGSVVFAKEVDAEKLEVGDVITFSLSGNTRVTHRIVEIDANRKCVITKGDANEVVDGNPVPFDKIIGRVNFHVPLLGYVSIYIKTPIGIAAICGVLFVMIVLNFLPDIINGDKEKEKKKSND